MKIIKLQAENFKKLKAVEIIPQGNIVEITGKCEQGKTTVLDAISAALCGTKWDEPIRTGEDKGKIVIDLGDKIVTRTFTKAGGTLKVESKDGAKYPSPQALLDKMVGKIAFDPLAFSREKDPKKQVDMLLKVVDIKVDVAHLKDISGIVVPVMDNPLDMLNQAYKSVYEERTAVNRQADAAVKTLGSLAKVEKIEPVLLTELVAERDRLEGINRDNKAVTDEEFKQRNRIDQMKENKELARRQIEELSVKLADFLVLMDKENQTLVALSAKVAKLKDQPLTEINAKISTADATNLQAQQYLDYQAKQTEAEWLTIEATGLTDKIEAIKKYKTEIISNTKFPVPGLDFAGGGVIFNDKPFSQASKAQQMRVGIGIGMSANPDLRVIMLDGYESLDSDQRAIVEELAAEHDFQVWCSTVTNNGTVGFYIEDGEIK
jgi:DNA repair exonuclease SbcCD ATPase subunit